MFHRCALRFSGIVTVSATKRHFKNRILLLSYLLLLLVFYENELKISQILLYSVAAVMNYLDLLFLCVLFWPHVVSEEAVKPDSTISSSQLSTAESQASISSSAPSQPTTTEEPILYTKRDRDIDEPKETPKIYSEEYLRALLNERTDLNPDTQISFHSDDEEQGVDPDEFLKGLMSQGPRPTVDMNSDPNARVDESVAWLQSMYEQKKKTFFNPTNQLCNNGSVCYAFPEGCGQQCKVIYSISSNSSAIYIRDLEFSNHIILMSGKNYSMQPEKFVCMRNNKIGYYIEDLKNGGKNMKESNPGEVLKLELGHLWKFNEIILKAHEGFDYYYEVKGTYTNVIEETEMLYKKENGSDEGAGETEQVKKDLKAPDN
ncbi:hypothetical protein L3Y34_013492 [Caenorhabditis briggsae]|uniref:Uncharacterized protein n=2 Tax=Caenorhabditis briggsae TaxID=6238 RepID=A0AAE9CWD7_CAEBR|nr:hypothetical protein L3Y34_013492 [Caenorhabditis briggsae]